MMCQSSRIRLKVWFAIVVSKPKNLCIDAGVFYFFIKLTDTMFTMGRILKIIISIVLVIISLVTTFFFVLTIMFVCAFTVCDLGTLVKLGVIPFIFYIISTLIPLVFLVMYLIKKKDIYFWIIVLFTILSVLLAFNNTILPRYIGLY